MHTVVVFLFVLLMVAAIILVSRAFGVDPIGKPPIHPYLLIIGKICTFTSFTQLFLSIGTLFSVFQYPLASPTNASFWAIALGFVLFILGVVFIVSSFVFLGSAAKVGLPEEETSLQTEGIYKVSRNPMYVGFFMWMISSCLFVQNPFNMACALTGIMTHHAIVQSEEKFLSKRFGKEYEEYASVTPRYL